MSDPTESAGSKKDYSFGQVAIRENLCSFEQVKECLDIQSKLRALGVEPKKLGDILVEKGYMTPEQVARVAKLQSQSPAGGGKVQIPGYEILSKIGMGAMGSVYKARQVSMDRIVAVKVLAGRYSKDRSFVERFLREARAVAKLNHENVISGIDVGEIAGLHYFVMEFVDGSPVTSLMRKEPRLPEKRCLEIGLQVARALSHAHKHGIVHRDVKPENIMITGSGVAKLCDLGLAKQTKGDTGATMDGQSVGTPNYISPEQARGEENIDIRSDIYSLGCSLYHMATGTTPFDGPNPMVVMTKHVTEWAEPPKKRHPGVSEGFNALVVKMMQKRREDRPQDPDALIAQIETVLRGGSPPVAPATRVPPPPTSRIEAPHRRPITTSRPPRKASSTPIVAGVSVAAVVLGGILVMKVVGTSAPPPPPVKPPVTSTPVRTNPEPSESAADAVKNEIAQFRGVALPELDRDSRADRYTWPYSTLTKRLEDAKKAANIAAVAAWQAELNRFVKAADEAVAKHSGWETLKKSAKAHSDAGRFAQALEEIAKLKDVYRWLGEGVPTAAGREAAEIGAKLKDDIRETFVATLRQAEAQFANPQARDDAYGTLDTLLVSGDPARKSDVEAARARFFGAELKEIVGDEPVPETTAKATARLERLKKLHAGQTGAIALLDRLIQGLKAAQKSAVTAAVTKAAEAVATFRPKFDAALRARDLAAARRALAELCLPKEAALQTALLPAPGLDLAALKAWLDPARTAPPDARKVVGMAEEGVAFTAKYPNEPAREAYLALRTAALLEDLCEMALEGAKVQARDVAKFKAFSPVLQNAIVAEAPRLRKPGELSLETASTSSSPRVTVLLSPKGSPAGTLTEDDVVALARRAPAAANDPHFPLKAFHLYHSAEQLRSAKSWYEKLTTPELKAGLEPLASKFAGILSEAAEGEAEALYRDAYETLTKKKDAAGAKKKFLECVEKYGMTDYMRKPVPSLGKSRVEVVESQYKTDGRSGGGGARRSLKEIFGTADVRDLGRGRYEAVYQFKEDAELAAFFAADGNPAVNRTDQGLSLSGPGQWCWKAPLKGNAQIEVAFRAAGEQPFGLVLHGTKDQAGYVGVCDIPIGAVPVDALLRFPLTQGPGAMLALAPANLAVARGANTASLTREGSRIRFTLNRVNVDGDNGQFQSGHVGVAAGPQPILIDRVRVVGEVDAAWLDAPK